MSCAAVGLYAFLGFLMDGPATLATSLIGLRISPHFDEPYRSHSIASFWGRRWNLTASNALRVLVYDTICDGAACSRVDTVPSGSAVLAISDRLTHPSAKQCIKWRHWFY